MNHIRKKFYNILEANKLYTIKAKVFSYSLQMLILLNVFAVIFGSVHELRIEIMHALTIFEIVSVIIFTTEYIVRVWCCVESNPLGNKTKIRLKYIRSFFPVIDLLAILPLYLIFVHSDLRLLRMVRLFKLLRHSKGLRLFGKVFYSRREELVATFFIFLTFLVIISYFAYWAEKEAQPEAFSSIPAAMWWGVATLTTVGYGDVTPITVLGKFIGAISAVIGIAMYTLPSGIIVSGFMQEWEKERERQKKEKIEE